MPERMRSPAGSLGEHKAVTRRTLGGKAQDEATNRSLHEGGVSASISRLSAERGSLTESGSCGAPIVAAAAAISDSHPVLVLLRGCELSEQGNGRGQSVAGSTPRMPRSRPRPSCGSWTHHLQAEGASPYCVASRVRVSPGGAAPPGRNASPIPAFIGTTPAIRTVAQPAFVDEHAQKRSALALRK